MTLPCARLLSGDVLWQAETGSAGLRVDSSERILPKIIDTVLPEIGADEFERALNLAQKKVRSMPNCDDQVARRRIFSMLGRKDIPGLYTRA